VTNSDQFRELIEPYALGTLDAEERSTFEAHLATGCTDCNKAVEEARWVVSQLAYMAPEAEPSDMLKGRLMQTVRAEAGSLKAVSSARPFVPVWLWAGAAALLVFSVYSLVETRKLRQEMEEARLRESQILQERSDAEKQLADLRRQAAIFADPASVTVPLTSPDPHVTQLEAKWSSQLGIVVIGQNVSLPQRDRVLQLWLIPKAPGAKPIPSSTIRPDADGKLVLVVPNPPELMAETRALAITEEPPGGSVQPTSPARWSGTIG
jgi:anti-sigma-K factor RskA